MTLVFLYDAEGMPKIVDYYKSMGVFDSKQLIGQYRTASPRYNLAGTVQETPVVWVTPPSGSGAFVAGNLYNMDKTTLTKLIVAKAKGGLFPHLLCVQNAKFIYSTNYLNSVAFLLSAPPNLNRVNLQSHVHVLPHVGGAQIKGWRYKDAINFK